MNEVAVQSYETLAVVDDPKERLNQGWLESVMRDLDAAPRLIEAMEAKVCAHPHKLTLGTLKTKYYAWKKYGAAGLVDRRKLRKFGKANAWAECYMWYCEKHNRSNLGAWRAMITAMWNGEALQGVGTWREAWRSENPDRPVPAACPENWIPKRARYQTLQREVKKNPDYLFQIAVSRKGRKAGHEFLLPVLKTRTGLEVGQVYEFDDKHFDVEILMLGIGKVARPQEFIGFDIASGFPPVETIRPQYPDADGKKKNSLKEKEFRMMHAFLLTNVGFHPSGCRMVVEHGTTAIRADLEKRIKSIPVYGDLITYARSGILAEAVHAGMFKGDGGGNFRFKAYCEQAHRYGDSARAMLAGQVGQDVAHRPESHAAMVRYDQLIMDAVMKLPEDKRELVRYNLCDWQTFMHLNAMLTDAVYDDPNHRMEGWGDKNIMCYKRFDDEPWTPISALQDKGDEEREDILRHLATAPQHKMVRRMTRREVWQAGARKLVRVPMFELNMLLDESDAHDVTIKKDGTFGFTDQFYYGPDEMIFHATCKTRSGFQAALAPGRKYLCFTTPLHTEGGVIVDKESGKVVGIAPAYRRAPILDRDAIIRAAGAQNEDLAKKMMPVRGRHQLEAEARLRLIGQNNDVINGRVTPATAAAPDADDGVEDAMDRAAKEFVSDLVTVEG